MKEYEITLNGQTFRVRLLSDPRQEQVDVEVNGEAFTVEVRAVAAERDLPAVPLPPQAEGDPAAGGARQPSAGVAPSGSAVTAPLPGVIKSIAIRPGQRVSRGDPLLVIEAMKMDNVLRASREGLVETIHIAEGHQVAYGELLLEYRA
jgi:biotin carboxyl carrier protein